MTKYCDQVMGKVVLCDESMINMGADFMANFP